MKCYYIPSIFWINLVKSLFTNEQLEEFIIWDNFAISGSLALAAMNLDVIYFANTSKFKIYYSNSSDDFKHITNLLCYNQGSDNVYKWLQTVEDYARSLLDEKEVLLFIGNFKLLRWRKRKSKRRKSKERNWRRRKRKRKKTRRRRRRKLVPKHLEERERVRSWNPPNQR